jgi:hypothetical protein
MNTIRPTQAYIDESRAAQLLEKWAPVLDYTSKSVAAIEDNHTRLNTAMLLENQEAWCLNEAGPNYIGDSNVAGRNGSLGNATSIGAGTDASGTPGTDSYASGDYRLPKILIPMIRRTFPELITNEIVGVQPMAGPVGLAFALRYRYSGETLGTGIDGKTGAGNTPAGQVGVLDSITPGTEAGYQELKTAYTGTSAGYLSGNSDFAFADGDNGVAALLRNFEVTGNIPTMEVSFEKTAVEAGTRRLGARWSVELEQDLKNMNGIDIDTELTNAMSYEIQAEIDREMLMRMIQVALNAGSGNGYSIWAPQSADGRWLVERNRDFYQRLIVEANRIAVRNRRGAANFIVALSLKCSLNSSGYLFKATLIHNQLVLLRSVILVVVSTFTETLVLKVRQWVMIYPLLQVQVLSMRCLVTRVQSFMTLVSSTAHTSRLWYREQLVRMTSHLALAC